MRTPRLLAVHSLVPILLAVGCTPGDDDPADADMVDDTGMADTGSGDTGEEDTGGPQDTGASGDTGGGDTDPGDTGGADTGPDPSTVDADSDGVTADLDCDDNDPLRAPGLVEGCDDIDRDCDGPAREADTLSFVPTAAGSPSVVYTDQLATATAAAPLALTAPEAGAFQLCEGTYPVTLDAAGFDVTVEGAGAAVSTVESTGGACTLTGSGALTVRDLTLVGRDDSTPKCDTSSYMVQATGPTLVVQDAVLRDHAYIDANEDAGLLLGPNTLLTLREVTLTDVDNPFWGSFRNNSAPGAYTLDDVTISGQTQTVFVVGAGEAVVRDVTLTDSTRGLQISDADIDDVTIADCGDDTTPARGLFVVSGDATIDGLVVRDSVYQSKTVSFGTNSRTPPTISLTDAQFLRNTDTNGTSVMTVDPGTHTFTDVLVEDNEMRTLLAMGSGSAGGAPNLTCDACVFRNNVSGYGMSVSGSSNGDPTVTFVGTDNLFEGNSLLRTFRPFGHPVMWVSLVGAGVQEIDVTGVTFRNNPEGAMRLGRSGFSDTTGYLVRGGTFVGNTGDAAISSDEGTLEVVGGTFENNEYATGLGAAVFAADLTRVADATFVGNTAGPEGGAIAESGFFNAGFTVENSTFEGNIATAGGAFAPYGSVTVQDCTFGTGADANTPGSVYLRDASPPAHAEPTGGTWTCTTSACTAVP